MHALLVSTTAVDATRFDPIPGYLIVGFCSIVVFWIFKWLNKKIKPQERSWVDTAAKLALLASILGIITALGTTPLVSSISSSLVNKLEGDSLALSSYQISSAIVVGIIFIGSAYRWYKTEALFWAWLFAISGVVLAGLQPQFNGALVFIVNELVSRSWNGALGLLTALLELQLTIT